MLHFPSFSRRHTVLFLCFILLPVVSQLIVQWYHDKSLLWDRDVYLCAAERFLQNEPLYDVADDCQALPYVYVPFIAHGFGYAIKHWGKPLVSQIYTGLYVVCLLWLAIHLWRWVKNAKSAWQYIIFFGVCTFGAIASGNMSIFFYALLWTSLAHLDRKPWFFLIIVAFGACIKIQYACFLALPWLIRLPRAYSWLIVGTMLCALPYLFSWQFDPVGMQQWLNAIHALMEGEDLGWGYLRAIHIFNMWGITSPPILSIVVYGLYASTLLLIGRYVLNIPTIPTALKPTMALMLAVLLLPRLKEYDMLVIAAGLYGLTTYLARNKWSKTRYLTWAMYGLAMSQPLYFYCKHVFRILDNLSLPQPLVLIRPFENIIYAGSLLGTWALVSAAWGMAAVITYNAMRKTIYKSPVS